MMGQMQGLSAMGAEQQEAPGMEQGETAQMEQGEQQGGVTVEEVAQALMAGKSPEELVKAGVPGYCVTTTSSATTTTTRRTRWARIKCCKYAVT